MDYVAIEGDEPTGKSLPTTTADTSHAVQTLVESLGRDASVWATGRSWKQLSRYVQGASEPPFSVVLALARAAGRSVDALTDGRSELEEQESLDSFTMVPRLGVEASAGYGLVGIAEEITERLAFKTDWLRDMGLSPQYLALVTCRGDSQDPIIKDGALMLVDTTPDQHIRSGCFYIIVLEGDVLVKLVNRRIDGTIELISHNPAYPKEIVDGQQLDRLTIPGSVVRPKTLGDLRCVFAWSL
jgi:phage repressor protein C with HTH and peptisase S24 domain